MKKVLFATIAAAVLAGAAFYAFADDDAAYSANAVGVVKYTIPSNGVLTCVSLPLDPFGGEDAWYWPDTELAKGLQGGSIVYFWNNNTLDWEYSTKSARGTWPAIQTTNLMMVSPGQAFFLRGPSGTKSNVVVSLLGELPVEESMSVGVTGGNNFDMRAISMYPIEVVFTNSAFATNLPGGSMVYFWNGADWVYSTKNVRSNTWSTVEGKETLRVGEGVFVKKSGAGMTVTEGRPFDWE